MWLSCFRDARPPSSEPSAAQSHSVLPYSQRGFATVHGSPGQADRVHTDPRAAVYSLPLSPHAALCVAVHFPRGMGRAAIYALSGHNGNAAVVCTLSSRSPALLGLMRTFPSSVNPWRLKSPRAERYFDKTLCYGPGPLIPSICRSLVRDVLQNPHRSLFSFAVISYACKSRRADQDLRCTLLSQCDATIYKALFLQRHLLERKPTDPRPTFHRKLHDSS